jgi:mRNA-degrading endonuclease toxin of MazEF toxin-antitoxin module
LRRGAVHWVSLDKQRPAIILSPDVRNRLANDVIVIPCSTTARRMPWHVQLRRGEAGLPQACMAKCEQVATIPKGWVEPTELGMLTPQRMREVELALVSALGIVVPHA